MPTYDYRCNACGHEFELFQSITASHKRKCPKCSKMALERLIGIGGAVLFKGGGFYETDYRSESYKKSAEADKKASEEKPKSDAKPAAQSESKADAKQGPKPDSSSSSGSVPDARPDTTSGSGPRSKHTPAGGGKKPAGTHGNGSQPGGKRTRKSGGR